MAFVSQDRKKALAPQIKAVLKKYGMKGTIAVRHHSTLVVNIRAGKLDIIGNMMENATEENNWYAAQGKRPDHIDVNEYHIDRTYTGEVAAFLTELKDAMNGKGCETEKNFDNSDIMTDYFHVGWYIDINVGNWNKPYVLEAAAPKKARKAPAKKAAPVVERDEWADFLNAGGSF